MSRLFVVSIDRWNGGAAERRKHGGAGTVTRFLVGYEGTELHTWVKIVGHGASPSTRKAAALAQFKAAQSACLLPCPTGTKCLVCGD